MSPARERRAAARRGARVRLVLVWITVLVIASCGRGTGIDRAAFEHRLIDREHVTAAQARCVTGYVFAEYRPDEIQDLAEHGITLSRGSEWAPYGHALLGCMFHDELTGPSSQRPGR